MKTRAIYLVIALALQLNIHGQGPLFELGFTALDSASHIQLDSIQVINQTQECDTVLYWPDTALSIFAYMGLPAIKQNYSETRSIWVYPNPAGDHVFISIKVDEKEDVTISILDMLGRNCSRISVLLDRGIHSFRFESSQSGMFIINAQTGQINISTKMLLAGSGRVKSDKLEYEGNEPAQVPHLKSEAIGVFAFDPGDELVCLGYAGSKISGIGVQPEESHLYAFQYSSFMPCMGDEQLEYGGQVYHTTQILSQCWFRENLNIGTMLIAPTQMENNGIIEKYCYNNEPDSCIKYGGLYNLHEAREYNNQQGTHGICPEGWHIPTDSEFKLLEGAVDSQFGIWDPEWDKPNWRGYDAGTNLRSTDGWLNGVSGTDLYGFSALPGGSNYRFSEFFSGAGTYARIWSSTEWASRGYARILGPYSPPQVFWSFDLWLDSFSIRCVRDYDFIDE